jgi:hypothetical protein
VDDAYEGSRGCYFVGPALLHRYVSMVVQIRGQGALPGSILSHHVRIVSDALVGRNP